MAAPFNLKRWSFRLLAITVALLPLVGLELLCVVMDWGAADDRGDPFIGFEGTRPLFVKDEAAGRYRIAENRYLCFRPDEFAIEKAANEFRVFCLGGSTVQGRPYAIETSFTKWFEHSLAAADPSRTFDVVNCGGISYASYRLVPILEEVLLYEPDLIILYTGHNEFLEDRTYQPIKGRSTWHRWSLQAAMRLRLYRIVWSQWNAWQTRDEQGAQVDRQRATLPTEVEARLDYEGGLQQYQRDPVWNAGVVEHFEVNLRRMVRQCREKRIPMWLVNPVCNLRSSPPFKSLNRDDLSLADRQQWQRLREEASELFAGSTSQALQLLLQALEIDDQHAGLAYDLGKAYEMLGQMTKAREFFLKAKELDICPLRMTEPLRERLKLVASSEQVPLIDVAGMFQRKSRDGIPGGFYLVDHVHPSITGHQMIADLLMQEAIAERWVKPEDDWQRIRQQRYQEQMAALDDRYFMEAQRRLRGLTLWAQGRAKQQRE